MKRTLFFILILLSIALKSQFTSPGLGTKYSMNELSNLYPASIEKISDTEYNIKENFTIAQNDSLVINVNNILIKVNPNVLIKIAGYFETNSSASEFTSTTPSLPYQGLLFEESSKVKLLNSRFSYGGGIKSKTAKINVDHCEFYKNSSGISTVAALEIEFNEDSNISYSPIIQNSKFIENKNAAFVNSINNGVCFAQFLNNHVKKNGKNTKAQIEIKFYSLRIPNVTTDTIRIKNNQITGDRNILAGGFYMLYGLLPFVIANNTISDNTFGADIQLNGSLGYNNTHIDYIYNNNVFDNNVVDNNLVLAGAGFSFAGGGAFTVGSGHNIVIYKNIIRNNVKGIVTREYAKLDLGSDRPRSIGRNIFYNNKTLNETIALFITYRGLLPIAKFNCWREGEVSNDQMVLDVIKTDYYPLVDSYKLERTIPYDCGEIVLNTNDINKKSTPFLYPNPNNGTFIINSDFDDKLIIFDPAGRKLHASEVKKGENTIQSDLKPGVYFLELIKAKKKNKVSIQ